MHRPHTRQPSGVTPYWNCAISYNAMLPLSLARMSAHLPVSPEEQARWSSVLPKGERIVVSGTVGKKNPMGMTQTRQLLITVGAADGPHIRYGDIKSHTLKGEVEYPSKQLPTANVVRCCEVCQMLFICCVHTVTHAY